MERLDFIMRMYKIDELSGGEILGRDIISPDYQVLLTKGTSIRKDYIDKLKDIGVTRIFINEDINADEVLVLKNDIEENFKDSVKTIMEKHTYCNNDELVELTKTADHIFSSLLDQEEVIEKIYDIKERSSDIYEHSVNVCTLAILTALKMEIPHQRIHDIGVSCLLHDLGLMYLTFDYTNLLIEKLSKSELEEYKKHPMYAYTELRNETWISDISKNIILYHHEYMDGSGYPLNATEIPIEARIVCICDTFDEMICGISYKGVKVYEAIEYLKRNKDILFDGSVVDVFLGLTAVYPAGSCIRTSEGEIGIVLRQNKDYPDKPLVKIIYDKRGEIVQNDLVIDLSIEENNYIKEVIENIIIE